MRRYGLQRSNNGVKRSQYLVSQNLLHPIYLDSVVMGQSERGSFERACFGRRVSNVRPDVISYLHFSI